MLSSGVQAWQLYGNYLRRPCDIFTQNFKAYRYYQFCQRVLGFMDVAVVYAREWIHVISQSEIWLAFLALPPIQVIEHTKGLCYQRTDKLYVDVGICSAKQFRVRI